MPLYTNTNDLQRSEDIWPLRIVSLVPSITELVVDLSGSDSIVGCTKFCVHPSGIRTSVTSIGGTKNLKNNIISDLKPSLIIANKEENLKDQVLALAENHTVLLTDISSVEDNYELIQDLGTLLDQSNKAETLINATRRALGQTSNPKGSAIYLIWRKPYMAAGGDTFIHQMMTQLGFTNALASQDRYPTITLEEIKNYSPDHILLSSEPYPFGEIHIDEIKEICPKANIQLVDGEAFSWYGSRSSKLKDYYDQV